MRKGMLFLLSIICLMSIWIVRNNEQTKQGTAARETVPHLTAYVSAKEDIGRALLSSYCEQAGCTYEFVRLSTEELVRRVTKEADHPRADVIIGGTWDAHQTLKQRGLSTPFPSDMDQAELQDPDRYWIGYEVERLAIVINTDVWNNRFGAAPYPKTLADLTAKRYQDELILPDPNHSGTGATILQAIFDGYGTKSEGVLRELIERTRLFTANGFAPTSYVASGEAMLGVNFIGDQQSLREKYYPVKSIPLDTYSINAISKLKGRTQQKQANAFMRFVLSADGQAILRKVSFGTPIYAIAKTQPIQQNVGQDIVADYRDYLRRFNQLQDK